MKAIDRLGVFSHYQYDIIERRKIFYKIEN